MITQENWRVPSGGSTSHRPMPPTDADIRALIVAELANVRAMSPAELVPDLAAADGDLEVISDEAVVILSRLEVHFGCKLPTVSDLEPEQLNSIGSLTGLVSRRLTETGIAAPNVAQQETSSDVHVEKFERRSSWPK